MGLDVYLTGPEVYRECTCYECGNKHMAREHPTLYSANITHNLGKMAKEAGIYRMLWRPEEIDVFKADQLILPLRIGIRRLEKDPAYYKRFDSPNGWGKYEHFLPWLKEYLKACEDNPDADVSVSR
jgi:hypothetical protein